MVKGDMPSVTSGKAEKLEAVTNRRSLQETKSYIWHGLLNLFYSRLWFALVTNQHVDRKVSCTVSRKNSVTLYIWAATNPDALKFFVSHFLHSHNRTDEALEAETGLR